MTEQQEDSDGFLDALAARLADRPKAKARLLELVGEKPARYLIYTTVCCTDQGQDRLLDDIRSHHPLPAAFFPAIVGDLLEGGMGQEDKEVGMLGVACTMLVNMCSGMSSSARAAAEAGAVEALARLICEAHSTGEDAAGFVEPCMLLQALLEVVSGSGNRCRQQRGRRACWRCWQRCWHLPVPREIQASALELLVAVFGFKPSLRSRETVQVCAAALARMICRPDSEQLGITSQIAAASALHDLSDTGKWGGMVGGALREAGAVQAVVKLIGTPMGSALELLLMMFKSVEQEPAQLRAMAVEVAEAGGAEALRPHLHVIYGGTSARKVWWRGIAASLLQQLVLAGPDVARALSRSELESLEGLMQEGMDAAGRMLVEARCAKCGAATGDARGAVLLKCSKCKKASYCSKPSASCSTGGCTRRSVRPR